MPNGRGAVMTVSQAPARPIFTVPSLRCPLPRLEHRQAAGIEDHLVAWARKFDLLRSEAAEHRFRSCGFGRFAADVYPKARDLKLVAEWSAYSWLLDDHLDED